MDFKETVVDSLRYPFSSPKTFILLFVIFLAAELVFSQFTSGSPVRYSPYLSFGGIFAIIITIFTSGYLIRIVKSTLDNSSQLPEFKEFKSMGWDGIRYIVVNLVYSIPLAPLLIISFLFAPPSDISGGMSYTVFIMVSYITEFLLYVLTFMALGNMACSGSIAGAFKFKNVLQLIKNMGWKVYLIYVIIFSLIYIALKLIMDLIGFYGFVWDFTTMIIFLIGYGLISTYLLALEGRIIGSIYIEAQEKGLEE